MNKVFLIGNLTKDPEIRYSKSGNPVATFGIGVRRSMPNQNGEYESDFLNVVAYKHSASYVEKYITKGTRVAIEGTVQSRTYETEKGKHYIVEVVVNEITNLTPKNAQLEVKQEVQKEENAPKIEETTQKDPFAEFGKQVEIDDEVLPF